MVLGFRNLGPWVFCQGGEGMEARCVSSSRSQVPQEDRLEAMAGLWRAPRMSSLAPPFLRDHNSPETGEREAWKIYKMWERKEPFPGDLVEASYQRLSKNLSTVNNCSRPFSLAHQL